MHIIQILVKRYGGQIHITNRVAHDYTQGTIVTLRLPIYLGIKKIFSN